MPIIATDPELPARPRPATVHSVHAMTPEVVISSPAVIVPGQALTRFLSDPAGLKHDALQTMDIKVRPVETAIAAADLSDQISQAQTLVKNIEARRKQHVEPLKKEARAIDEEAARWRGPIEAFIGRAKDVILAFNRLNADRSRRAEEARQEAIREAAKQQRQAEIMGNTAAVEAASVEIMRHEAVTAAQAVTGYKTDAGTTSTRKRWVPEVVDESLVPDVYLIVDQIKLQAAVDAGAREIPGCNIYEKETLSVRPRG